MFTWFCVASCLGESQPLLPRAVTCAFYSRRGFPSDGACSAGPRARACLSGELLGAGPLAAACAHTQSSGTLPPLARTCTFTFLPLAGCHPASRLARGSGFSPGGPGASWRRCAVVSKSRTRAPLPIFLGSAYIFMRIACWSVLLIFPLGFLLSLSVCWHSLRRPDTIFFFFWWG